MARTATSVARNTFRAMGTHVTLLGPADGNPVAFARATHRVRTRFEREESRFSRFRADSELTRVNARAGQPTLVSGAFADLVSFALDAAGRTSGRFDPTVLDAMVAAGYDRDFDEVLAGARAILHPTRPCGRWKDVVLDGRALTLPPGTGLDLGGVAKGWAVDRAATDALGEGLPWAVVNAGGDLRISGAPPSEGTAVGIEDPDAPEEDLLRIVLVEGALATSSIRRRAWGAELHHLIDPTTGAPARTGVAQATVWAPTCAEAEVLAKDALLEGETALDRIPGVLVTTDDRVVTNLANGMEVAA